MKPGSAVSAFEKEFASYVGAKYAIALSNGTVTLEVALRALGVQPGDKVATTPLTMAATSIAILNVGAVPVYCDVNPDTWLMTLESTVRLALRRCVPVSLYGLHAKAFDGLGDVVDDAAQTLRPHSGCSFTSYSFQASKILALGEGGMLVTNDEELATIARSISSLGYDMLASQSRIDKDSIKSPDAIRHVRYPCLNARMNDLTAAEGLRKMRMWEGPVTLDNGVHFPHAKVHADGEIILGDYIAIRRKAASYYRDAIAGCSWLQPQLTPDGYVHDYWTFAVACDSPARAKQLSATMQLLGAEIPFPAWRLTFDEPAFKHLDPGAKHCVNARQLQPRLLQMQTNNLDSASRNASALRKAIQEMT